MYKIETPQTDSDLDAYFKFRWEVLRKPLNYPEGSEKDEYEQVAEHRMIVNSAGEILAAGRMHYNTPEEIQIRHIAVRKDQQGKGLGKFIVSALEAEAVESGAIRSVTNSLESSVEFFTQCGYQVEGDAPNELGTIKRKHMLKRLSQISSLMLHPKWCENLQKTWYNTIPISEQMGIRLHKYTGHTLETRASLNKNINLHGTMFAGSIFSLATLTGWGMIHLQLREKGLEGDIVLGDGDIHYHKPITSQPRAVCYIESIVGKFAPLTKGKKANVTLNVKILDKDTPVAEFTGVFWVLPIKDDIENS